MNFQESSLNWIRFGQNSNIELNQFGYRTRLSKSRLRVAHFLGNAGFSQINPFIKDLFCQNSQISQQILSKFHLSNIACDSGENRSRGREFAALMEIGETRFICKQSKKAPKGWQAKVCLSNIKLYCKNALKISFYLNFYESRPRIWKNPVWQKNLKL